MTCVTCASYGISVRFPTLSHIQRQVAHALLTRPPLSYLYASRRINSNSSVRLECVMHAASVHPEPGSNSRKIYIISQLSLSYNLSSYFILASFTLLSIYNSIDEICTCFFCFVLISCCSIFNDRLLPFSATALLVYHNTFLLSIPFLKFF